MFLNSESKIAIFKLTYSKEIYTNFFNITNNHYNKIQIYKNECKVYMKIKSFDLPFTVNLINKQELSNYL